MKVYISGPITGLAPAVYCKAFRERADWVVGQGWQPVNPLDGHNDRTGCCDAITTLPGWQASNGARAEVFVAATVGLRFITPDAQGGAS